MKISLILLIVITYFIGCKKKDNITNSDYNIGINDTFRIELPANTSTGYSWIWVNKQEISIVDTFNCYYISDQPMMLGGSGKEIWKFRGKTKGTGTVKLEYKRSWESNSTVNSKDITITVK